MADAPDLQRAQVEVPTIADQARKQGRGYLAFSPLGLLGGLILERPTIALISAIWLIACPLLIKHKRIGLILFLLPFLIVSADLLYAIFTIGPSVLRIGFLLGLTLLLWSHLYTFGPVLWGKASWHDPDRMERR